jgi:copper resistance protein C
VENAVRSILSAADAFLITPALTQGAALAHAHPASAIPLADSSETTAPKDVSITFTEALQPRFSSIQVQNAAGLYVDDGASRLAPDNTKHFRVGLKPLTPGVYTVI